MHREVKCGFAAQYSAAGGFTAAALLIFLCVLPQGSTRTFTWPWVLYAQLLGLLPIVALGLALIAIRGASSIKLHALGFCGASIGLSVAFSANPHFSFEAALPLWGALALTGWLALRLRNLASDDNRFMCAARLAGLALLAPLLSSFWFWAAATMPLVLAADSLRSIVTALGSVRNTDPFGHPNYTAGFALLSLPWLGGLVLVERTRWRAVWIAAASLCPVLLFSSMSRGGVIGAFALIGTAAALSYSSGRLSRRSSLWLVLATVVCMGFLVVSNARLRALLTDSSALSYPSVSDVQRLSMLEGGWLLAKQRPWVGHGPGMVPFSYPDVRRNLTGGVETAYQLHNAYLHHWVVTGLVGLGSGVALALTLFYGLRGWLRASPSVPRTFALSSVCALIGYGAMAATDYQFDVLGILAALSLPTAMLLTVPRRAAGDETMQAGTNRRDVTVALGSSAVGAVPISAGMTQIPRTGWQGRGGWRAFSGWVLIIGVVVALIVVTPHWVARYCHWDAWVSTDESDYPGRIRKLSRASAAAPWSTHYVNQIGLQLAEKAINSRSVTQRGLAREALISSIVRDSRQEPILANLGWLWLPDYPHRAAADFRSAIALIPDRDTLHYGLAIASLASGDKAGAVRALALECLVNPPFIGSPVWMTPEILPLRKEVYARLGDLIAEASRHPKMPRWRQRDLAYFGSFLRWWRHGQVPSAHELEGGDAVQRGFFSAAATARGAIARWPAPWNELARLEGEQGSESDPPMGQQYFAAWIGAVGRRQAGATAIVDLVRADPAANAKVIEASVERSHYRLMHRNLDGRGYRDLAPRVVDPFQQRYTEMLFPQRGLIPGTVLQDID